MNSKDLELAAKIGELASYFDQEWSEYQDWLRDIVLARSVLLERYPAWWVSLIFRWRLLYFVAYVGTIIFINQLLMIKSFLWERAFSNFTVLSARIASIIASLGLVQYRYILNRLATLLAVVELTLCGVAAFTGILLAFYYQPTALGAYKSLTTIVNEVTNGSLILSLHNLAGNCLIVFALIQIIVMFLGRQQLLSWLTAWISGICFTLTAIGLSWTAIVLNWEQTSFWRFKIELNIVASIPLVGSFLRDVLSGGNGINSVTLEHMYALHSYILVIVAFVLSTTHLLALMFQEQNWKPKDKQFRLTKLCSESVSQKDSSSI